MKKKANLKKEILAVIRDIITNYPETSVSIHLMMATQDYNDLGMLTDTALLYELEKYKNLLELDDSFQIENCDDEWLDPDNLFYDDDEI